MCAADGCTRKSGFHRICTAHRKKPCSIKACVTNAYARGVCKKHGALGNCVESGCITYAQNAGGYCGKHSKKVACAVPRCSTPAVPGRGVCYKHGAYGVCTTWGCKTNAKHGKTGLCTKHSKNKATCFASDCSNIVIARGLCRTHGAYGFCTSDGCDSGAVKGGLCNRHVCTKHSKDKAIRMDLTNKQTNRITPATKYGTNCCKHTTKM